MFVSQGFKDNALAITDEQVAADWQLGLLRALGDVLTHALPSDSTNSYGGAEKGSSREHVTGGNGVPFCPLVEIYDIREEKGQRRPEDTMGGRVDDVTLLKANASCKCGQLQKHPVSLNIDPGALISTVTNSTK